MNDNPSTFEIHPDEHLEARITAYVLGEASPFEAAEIESLIEKSPELKLFANRLRTLDSLLKEAETTANSPDAAWKLSGKRRIALAPILGSVPVLMPQKHKEHRIRRASFRAAFGIAAVFLVTLFTKRFFIFPGQIHKESPTLTAYSAAAEDSDAHIDSIRKAIREQEGKVEDGRKVLNTMSRTKDITYRETAGGSQAKKEALERNIDTNGYVDAKQDFEQGLAKLEVLKRQLGEEEISKSPSDEPTLRNDSSISRKPSAPASSMAKAVAAGTSSPINIPVPTEGLALAQASADFGDVGGGWGDGSGVGGGRKAKGREESVPRIATRATSADYGDGEDFASGQMIPGIPAGQASSGIVTGGLRSGDAAISRNTIDAILNNPDRTAQAGKSKSETEALQDSPADSSTVAAADPFSAPDSSVPADPESSGKGPEIGYLAYSRDLGLEMNLRAGSERQVTDESMDMDAWFSSSLGQAGDVMPGGINKDLSTFRYSNESDQAVDSDFDGFANYGAPINGKKKTSEMDIRGELPLMPTFFTAADDASVLTRSGAAANIEVIRESIYPTEFESANAGIAVEPFFNTSDATKSKGGIEYEINTGDKSEYLFRGLDLTTKEKPKPVDLADLSNEIPATQEPFSTFSLNISDASFQVASSAVAKGERPDPESIKPEQFYNAVSYDDPAPSTGEPVAAVIAQVAHPVIPGRNLVRMSVRTASTGRAATQPLVLTLLVDQSGSMARGDRRAAMDTALAQLATLLTPDDRITVIGFSRTPRLLADSISGNDAQKLPDIINQSASEGGTNLEQALDLAENLALRHKLDGAQNRIVLFTDGAANLGNADPERLAERVKALRQQDLAFDIAGIGTNDINDRLLSELSRHGDGRYYLVGENTAGNLAKQLAGAFRPAAENVKIQVKFNPQRVGGYKLIGFEKDRLKTEDFRNDSVDAAELAADESGTALYQVEPLPNGTGEIGELFIRFRDTATGEMVERSWTIPYESQAPAIDKAQPSMQLAALSLLAAQKLQTGPLADAINFHDLAPTIAAVKQTYAHSPEAQQMITLINALK